MLYLSALSHSLSYYCLSVSGIRTFWIDIHKVNRKNKRIRQTECDWTVVEGEQKERLIIGCWEFEHISHVLCEIKRHPWQWHWTASKCMLPNQNIIQFSGDFQQTQSPCSRHLYFQSFEHNSNSTVCVCRLCRFCSKRCQIILMISWIHFVASIEPQLILSNDIKIIRRNSLHFRNGNSLKVNSRETKEFKLDFGLYLRQNPKFY